jgi:hypothetical protein
MAYSSVPGSNGSSKHTEIKTDRLKLHCLYLTIDIPIFENGNIENLDSLCNSLWRRSTCGSGLSWLMCSILFIAQKIKKCWNLNCHAELQNNMIFTLCSYSKQRSICSPLVPGVAAKTATRTELRPAQNTRWRFLGSIMAGPG